MKVCLVARILSEIISFVLVGPVSISTTGEEILNILDSWQPPTQVTCIKKLFSAIDLAFKHAITKSFFFIFTDGKTEEEQKVNELISIAAMREITVNFPKNIYFLI